MSGLWGARVISFFSYVRYLGAFQLRILNILVYSALSLSAHIFQFVLIDMNPMPSFSSAWHWACFIVLAGVSLNFCLKWNNGKLGRWFEMKWYASLNYYSSGWKYQAFTCPSINHLHPCWYVTGSSSNLERDHFKVPLIRFAGLLVSYCWHIGGSRVQK